MPRAIWNGVISFGLLNIPVSLQAAQRSTDLHFRMLDSRDNARIRFERVNADTGEEVPWKEIVKAYEYERGNFVVLDDEDFQRAAPESHDSVEIESFIDRDAINPMYFEKPYYLVPGKRAAKGYVLLREVLERSHRVAIARVVIRTREHLSVVMPLGHALVLLLIRFPQELIKPDSFDLPTDSLSEYRLNARELAMAEELVDSMTVDFDPDSYVDDFRARLHEAIDARIKADETVQPPDLEEIDRSPSTNVVDFMALLKKSLRGGNRSPAAEPVRDDADEPASRRGATAKRGGKGDDSGAAPGPAPSKAAGDAKRAAKSAPASKAGAGSKSRNASKSGAAARSGAASKSRKGSGAGSTAVPGTTAKAGSGSRAAKTPAKAPAKTPAKTRAKTATKAPAKTPATGRTRRAA